jgi:NAD(P)H-hydrate epimerase
MIEEYTLPLPTPGEMGEWDRLAIEEYGIRQEILMENASRECLAVLLEEYGDLADAEVLVLAGSGNNGGDAVALARHLDDMGARVLLLHKARRSDYKGASGYNVRLAAKLGLDMAVIGDSAFSAMPEPDLVVDGLLGTGFKGELRQDYLDLVDRINELGRSAFVLAVDVPSGLDGESGEASPTAVMADVTVTFHAPKTGLAMPGAGEFTGDLHVRDIGIPARTMRDVPPSHRLMTDMLCMLYPEPEPEMHKGTAGHTLIVGGSPGLTGAPCLAALGALRGGTGLATVACPSELSTEIKAGIPDVMTMPLGQGERHWSAKLAGPLAEDLERFDSLLVGPGLGRDQGALDFMKKLLSKPLSALILDADALFWLAMEPGLMKGLPKGTILTPHPGEMARLLDRPASEVQKKRSESARELSDRTGATVVLKGAGTVVAGPEGPGMLCPVASANLSVGGTGDVLAGLAAALRGLGLGPAEAAALAVHWHASAGIAAEEEFPFRGNLASEIAELLPQTMADMKQC